MKQEQATYLGKRKNVTDVVIKPIKFSSKPPNYFRAELLRANIEVYWCEINERNDSFLNHLHKAIESDPRWKSHGFLCTLWRRTSVDNDTCIRNERDRFPRKVIVRIPPNNEISTPESRLHALTLLRNFCVNTENNKFNQDYIVDETSDLTPDDDVDLRLPDSYLQDTAICSLIEALFEDAGRTWFRDNEELAVQFWTGPAYPSVAQARLGYPVTERS